MSITIHIIIYKFHKYLYLNTSITAINVNASMHGANQSVKISKNNAPKPTRFFIKLTLFTHSSTE